MDAEDFYGVGCWERTHIHPKLTQPWA